jgi:hypothetical protein
MKKVPLPPFLSKWYALLPPFEMRFASGNVTWCTVGLVKNFLVFQEFADVIHGDSAGNTRVATPVPSTVMM